MAKQRKIITKKLPNCTNISNDIFTRVENRRIQVQETSNQRVYIIDMCSIKDIIPDKIPSLNALIVAKVPQFFPHVTITIFNKRLIAMAPVEKFGTSGHGEDGAIFGLINASGNFMQTIFGWLTPAGKAKLTNPQNRAVS